MRFHWTGQVGPGPTCWSLLLPLSFLFPPSPLQPATLRLGSDCDSDRSAGGDIGDVSGWTGLSHAQGRAKDVEERRIEPNRLGMAAAWGDTAPGPAW